MTGTDPACRAAEASGDDAGAVVVPVIGTFLSLAAAPTFAAMAMLTGVLGGAPMDTLCPAGPGAALSGMVPMYLLMSMFHASPWLKLASAIPRGAPDRQSEEIDHEPFNWAGRRMARCAQGATPKGGCPASPTTPRPTPYGVGREKA